MTTTDTPLTDAKARELQHDTLVRGVDWRIIVDKALQHAYQLERELCSSKAEVDKLHTENQKLTELCETALYYHENDEIRSQTRKQLDQLNHNSNNKPS
jgi:hypothetical protein